ncbi:chemotaxis protein CheX [Paenibacillus monticola]|uniref:Chemotaxis protein CheX n=1 Tax=Paenibacillus monticola TaxID=2666075 RepID=A0A7X2HBV2_9BACL|nr:chemotaxis protein CheX [Paenibacillus monticola]MRN56553.1 chemotaxis protein CheX [Paenibacillus monticola]
MKAEVINPFLESARIVIEQVIQISPSTGIPGIKEIELIDNHIWIQVGMSGQLTGNIIFGIAEQVALKIVSAMMGGYLITEMDDMGKSAISELGNMISGNASTILSNQGVLVDITPPKLMQIENMSILPRRALSIPLLMEGIGELDIQVMIS